MNHDEAKNILLLYRHGTADADDPQIAGALALADRDQELKDWLVVHCARQYVLREKFRQIAAPAGLKEQIISEQTAFSKMKSRREKMILVAAVTAIVVSLAFLAQFWLPQRSGDDNSPGRVVAPTKVNGLISSVCVRALGPCPMMMSIW